MRVAFLTMEMLIEDFEEPFRSMNFRGGLGILAGDIARTMRNVGIDAMCFVPFYSRPWFAKDNLLNYERYNPMPFEALSNGQKIILGNNVHCVNSPVVFDILYTEDRQKRFFQEAMFALAVSWIMKDAGFVPDVLWLNESHTSLIIPRIKEDPFFSRTKILFTTHTPVQAGMEKFYEYNIEILCLGEKYRDAFINNGVLDLTRGAIILSDAVNAVSKEHEIVTKEMFPDFAYKISGIRNGSDLKFWTNPKLRSQDDLLESHEQARKQAFGFINDCDGASLDLNKPTAWFVRRLAGYKNLYPMLEPILSAICADRGSSVDSMFGPLEGLGMQVVGAGMASETDAYCLGWMSEFSKISHNILPGRFVFIPKYNTKLLLHGAQGSDIWLVTPEPRLEACGTSDQRAIMNGIPVITSRTGGMAEYIEEFNLKTRNGCGFFIEPYDSKTLYEKLKIFSEIWYAWKEKGDDRYLKLKINAFQKRKEIDILSCLEAYKLLMTLTCGA